MGAAFSGFETLPPKPKHEGKQEFLGLAFRGFGGFFSFVVAMGEEERRVPDREGPEVQAASSLDLMCFENGGKIHIGLLNAWNGNWEISMFFFFFFLKSRVDRFASSRDLVNL